VEKDSQLGHIPHWSRFPKIYPIHSSSVKLLLPSHNEHSKVTSIDYEKCNAFPSFKQAFPSREHRKKQQYFGEDDDAEVYIGSRLKRQGPDNRAHCKHEEDVKDI